VTSDLDGAWQALCLSSERFGYASLSDHERVWLNLGSLIDSVENGGLISYFYNSDADRLADCQSALRLVDAGSVLVANPTESSLMRAVLGRSSRQR